MIRKPHRFGLAQQLDRRLTHALRTTSALIAMPAPLGPRRPLAAQHRCSFQPLHGAGKLLAFLDPTARTHAAHDLAHHSFHTPFADGDHALTGLSPPHLGGFDPAALRYVP